MAFTMSPGINPSRIVRKIEEALDRGGDERHLAQLAKDYAQHCASAAERIDQCAFLLEKGDDFGAWKLTSMPPDLLDLVALLGFPREDEWRTLCAERGFPVAPVFDEVAVGKIGDLYSKAIDESHPFYAVYRAAMRKRDLDAAYAALDAIVRKNPKDTHAKQEQMRMLASRAAAKEKELRELLKAESVEPLLLFLDREEGSRIFAAVNPDLVAEAVACRASHWAKLAQEEVIRLLGASESSFPDEAFKAAQNTLGKVLALVEEHSLTLSHADQTRLDSLKTSCDKAQKAKDDEAKRQNALLRLDSSLGAVENLLVRGGLSSLRLGEEHAKLIKSWRELEAFGRPVPERLQIKFNKITTTLKGRRAQKEKQTKILFQAVALAAIIALAAGGFFFHRASQTKQFTRQLADTRERGTVGEATFLIDLIQAKHGALVKKPRMQAEINTTQAWIKDLQDKAVQFERDLANIETGLGRLQNGSSLEEFTQVLRAIERGKPKLAELDREDRIELETRFIRAETSYREKVGAWSLDLRETLDTQLGLMEQQRTALEAVRQLDEVAAPLEALRLRLGTVADMMTTLGSVTTLPLEIQSRYRAGEATLGKWERVAGTWNDVRAEMRRVASAEAHLVLLDKLSILPLESDPLVSAAKKARILWTTLAPEQLARRSFFPEDPQLQAFLEAFPNHRPEPSAFPSFPPEREIFLKMVEALPRGEVWQFQLVSAAGPATILYAENEPKKIGQHGLSNNRTAEQWRGNVYLSPGSPVPTEIMYASTSQGRQLVEGQAIRTLKPSPEIGFIKRYFTTDAIDGGTGKFRESIIRILDRLSETPDLSPHFVAYVEQELFKIIALRPYHWGIHLSPSLRDYQITFKDITRVEFTATDWLSPNLANRNVAERLTSTRPSANYIDEQTLNTALLSEFRRGGFKWLGYIGHDSSPVLPDRLKTTYVFTISEKNEIISGRMDVMVNDPMITPLPFAPIIGYESDEGLGSTEVNSRISDRFQMNVNSGGIRPIGIFQ